MYKYLGKIEKVKFGLGGYQEAMLGISFSFQYAGGLGSSDFKGAWDPENIEYRM
jgi:hypothetical protein